MESYGLSLKNCAGYSSDGEANMTGENNSVWSYIRAVAPDCDKMPCLYQSLALCVQKGIEFLPLSLEFIGRRENIIELFRVMQGVESEKSVPLLFFTNCRPLSGSVAERL